MALRYILKSGIVMLPALFLFFKIALAISDPCGSIQMLVIICSSSVKIVVGILIGIALNLLIALAGIDMFTIFVLPIHEHGMSFHFFVSSSISLVSTL